MEREKIAMENLKNQMEKEKQYQIDRRNRIKQAQYEDYNNYLRQKYSTPPENREKLNIKLGGEQRNIKKMNYNEEMDNLCINPTTQKYEEFPNAINYSEMGRKYQKGYSHGYNIITGEIYSDNNQNRQNNINYNNNNNYNNEINDNNKNVNERKGINISPEEYEEFLRYKEMKRQKEMERQQQIEKEKYNNSNDYIKNNEIRQNKYEYEKAPKEYLNQYQNYERQKPKSNFHYEEPNEQPKRFDEIREKQNFIKQENKYYEDYQNRLMQNKPKENNRDYGQIPQNYNEEQNQYQYQNNRENNEKKYVYENVYRKFTQEDIDFIYEICLGLADIIIDELHDSVTNFFLKKDNNKGASMGAVLLAAGSHGKRFALPNARIMVHQPSGGFGGTAADAEIQVNELLHYKTLLYDILAKHIGKPADQIKKDSDRDFFMSATAAQEYGVVDQVLPPNESKR